MVKGKIVLCDVENEGIGQLSAGAIGTSRLCACLKFCRKNWTCDFRSVEPNSRLVEQDRTTLPFYTISWT